MAKPRSRLIQEVLFRSTLNKYTGRGLLRQALPRLPSVAPSPYSIIIKTLLR